MRLGEICQKIGSGATPTGGKNSYADSGISLIRSQNVLDFAFSYNGLAHINEEQADKLRNVNVLPDDVLLNITGDSVARVCMVDEAALPARVNQHVAIVRVDKTLADPYYVMLWLVWQKNRLLSLASNGATRHALTKEMIQELDLSLPSLNAQTRVSRLLHSLDRKIALNRRKIATLEKMAKEIYDYWFVQHDFPDANGRPYKSSGGEMVYSPELKREIPKGWRVDTLRSRVKSVETGEWGSDKATDDVIEVHCLRGADMVDQSSLPRRFITRKKAGKLLSIGDLVVEISGGSPTQATGRICHVTEGLLKSYQGNLTCTNFCNSIKLEQPKEVASFYMLWKRLYAAGVMFGFEGKTSGLKNLQIDSFLSLKWDFAPLSLAEKYNELYDKMVASCDDSKQIIARCEQIRDFLLPLLMNGQVKVGE